MSLFIQEALERRAECRADFEDHRSSEYLKAEEWCRGSMLNERGKRAGVDAFSLFMGNAARANAYASEELREWWASHPRPTYARWEQETYRLYN